MRKIIVIACKEFTSCFHSWLGVLMGVLFYVVSGAFFSVLVLDYAKISMNPQQFGLTSTAGINQTQFIFASFFMNFSIILIFLVPLLTMRSFAEERRQETLELLFTYPLSDAEIAIGKYLGIVWFFETLLVPILGYLAIFHWLGGDFDWGPVILGFLGFWFLGMAYLAVGVFVSSLTKSSVVSAVGTFGILIVFWIFDWLVHITDGPWGQFFAAASPLGHYRHFTLGILNLDGMVYFGFFLLYFLFLSIRSIETRNWKS